MSNPINVNALTDIVSNSVGILIIFAVLNLAHESGRSREIQVPMEHETSYLPAFFIVKDEAVVRLEPQAVSLRAMAQISRGRAGEGETFEIGYRGLQGEMPRGDFIIHTPDTRDWDLIEDLDIPDSPLRKQVDGLDPTRQYAYVFVDDEIDPRTGTAPGFQAFRRLRQYLPDRGVRTGWRPVDPEHPAHLCFWDSLSRCNNYAPSYAADDQGDGP